MKTAEEVLKYLGYQPRLNAWGVTDANIAIRRGIPADAPVRYVVDRREAIRAAVRDAAPGDILLVAGKGHEDYQEVQGRKLPFDDVREVRNAMG